MAACAAPAISGEFSRPVVSGAALAAVVLAHRPSTQLPAELFGLGIDDVVAYYVAGGDPEAPSGAELEAALAPLDNEALAVTWTALPLAQRWRSSGAAGRRRGCCRSSLRSCWRSERRSPIRFHDGVRRPLRAGTGVALPPSTSGRIGSANGWSWPSRATAAFVGVGFEERFGLFVETAAPGDEAHLGVGCWHLPRTSTGSTASRTPRRRSTGCDAADRTPSEAFVELFTGNELERVMATSAVPTCSARWKGPADTSTSRSPSSGSPRQASSSTSAPARTPHRHVAPGSAVRRRQG